MARKLMDCSTIPSDSGCTLKLSGQEAEVLDAAVAHAVAVHGHEDTPELRSQLRSSLLDEVEPGFVQVIDFRTDDVAAIDAVEAEWRAETEGTRGTARALMCADRDEPGRYVVVVEFPSRVEAERNDVLPATQHFAEQMGKLVTAGPAFRNLDVLHMSV